MKNIIIVFGKLTFWVVFLWNTGWIQFLASSNDPGISKEQQWRADSVLSQFVSKKLEIYQQRVQAGYVFTPEEYFEYLKEKRVLEDSLHYSSFVISNINALQDILSEELRSGRCSYEALAHARKESGIEGSMLKNAQPFPHISIMSWLLHLYLHMIPFVILLFFLWIWERKESEVLSLKSPLCFFILVCIHPIYITRLVMKWWKKVGKSVAAEIEVRRRKQNLLARLSIEERSFITAFAKNKLTVQEFISWTEKVGYRRHSMACALIAIFISILTSEIPGRPIAHGSGETVVSLSQETHVLNQFVDHDIGNHIRDGDVVLSVCELTGPVKTVSRYISSYRYLLSNGYTQSCEPVPIV